MVNSIAIFGVTPPYPTYSNSIPRHFEGNNHMGVFKDALSEYGLWSGDKLKPADGESKMRILPEPRMTDDVQGKPEHEMARLGHRPQGMIRPLYMLKTIWTILPREERVSVGC
jgi:hypothetical protein